VAANISTTAAEAIARTFACTPRFALSLADVDMIVAYITSLDVKR
jgi:hypothetical protein